MAAAVFAVAFEEEREDENWLQNPLRKAGTPQPWWIVEGSPPVGGYSSHDHCRHH
jgi:hypothetical protein